MSFITNKLVVDKAKKLGFDLVGFAKAEILEEETMKLNEWLKNDYQAGMEYMERNFDKRKNVQNILPEARSVISLTLNYCARDKYSNEKDKGKISRYAWGKDYHLIMWQKLDELENFLKEIDPEFKSVSYVDTGPVMDKVWAVKAGIGWMGKHTNVINPATGSWFFIATLITNYEFDYSEVVADHCGTCTVCIDACPTGAIVSEYVVDANKCISFQTIENKGEISFDLKDKFDNWIFGCDTCQDVCPWNNKFAVITSEKDFSPVNKELTIDEILKLDDRSFKKKFAESPIKRTKLKGLVRNAKFVLG